MVSKRASVMLLALWASVLSLLVAPAVFAQEKITVWTAYTGKEASALKEVASSFEKKYPGTQVEILELPFGAFASKLRAAIPTGKGPDLFIDAHERLTSYLEADLLQAVPLSPATREELSKDVLDVLSHEGGQLGLPLSLKGAALYVNTDLVAEDTIKATEDITALKKTLKPGIYPLVMELDNPYYFAAFLHARGGELLTEDGRFGFSSPATADTISEFQEWQETGVVPEEVSGELVKRMFSNGQAALAVGGPWLAADFPETLNWRVQPLPRLSTTNQPLRPYVTVEAVFASKHRELSSRAADFANYLAGSTGAALRQKLAGQVVAARLPEGSTEGAEWLDAFRQAAESGVAMPTHENMRAVWEPAQRGMKRALRELAEPSGVLSQAQKRFDAATKPLPEKRDATWYLVLLGVGLLFVTIRMVQRASAPEMRAEIKRSIPAYLYSIHTFLAVTVLVIGPLLVGVGTSFFAGRGSDLYFVGFDNYADILLAQGTGLLGSGSFWVVLLVTVLWTVLNLAFHIGIGVTLALLLSRSGLFGSKLYRIALILPWAVPSYVTALCWKGMFHRQFGAINALLTELGAEPVSWFGSWSTAFAANLATNIWLGFPFMMVITLGALTSIPKSVGEAAAVDGATGWQRTFYITLPMLKPSLIPAAAMGAVWTFNMFNVVFLVSGGEPDGTTEILVSEAYRWAFTRSAQYGYAAAYAVLIFGILLLTSRFTIAAGQTKKKRADQVAPRLATAGGAA